MCVSLCVARFISTIPQFTITFPFCYLSPQSCYQDFVIIWSCFSSAIPAGAPSGPHIIFTRPIISVLIAPCDVSLPPFSLTSLTILVRLVHSLNCYFWFMCEFRRFVFASSSLPSPLLYNRYRVQIFYKLFVYVTLFPSIS